MHNIYDCQYIISNFFKKTGNNFYPLFRNNPSIISNYTLNDLKNGVIPNEHWEMLARKDVFEEYPYRALLTGIETFADNSGFIAFDFDLKNYDRYPQEKKYAERVYEDFIDHLTYKIGENFYAEKTRNGGYHVILRVSNPLKLKSYSNFFAMNDKILCELKGVGATCIIAPSPNYQKINGSDIINLEPISHEKICEITAFFSIIASDPNRWLINFKYDLKTELTNIYGPPVGERWLDEGGKPDIGIFCNGKLFKNFSASSPFTEGRHDAYSLLLSINKNIDDLLGDEMKKVYFKLKFSDQNFKDLMKEENKNYMKNGSKLKSRSQILREFLEENTHYKFGINEINLSPTIKVNDNLYIIDTQFSMHSEAKKFVQEFEYFYMNLTNRNISSKDLNEIFKFECSYYEKFNPMKDLIKNLPVWDRKERLERFFSDYCGSVYTEYTQKYAVYLFCSIIQKIMSDEGHRMEHMFTFVGPNKRAMSELLEIIAFGKEFYVNHAPLVSGFSFNGEKKTLLKLMHEKLIIQFESLEFLNKYFIQTVGQMISQKSDFVREIYCTTYDHRARKNIFICTRDEKNVLPERNYANINLPIQLGKIDLEEIKRDIGQIFAEAKIFLDENQNTEFLMDIAVQDEINEFLDSNAFVEEKIKNYLEILDYDKLLEINNGLPLGVDPKDIFGKEFKQPSSFNEELNIYSLIIKGLLRLGFKKHSETIDYIVFSGDIKKGKDKYSRKVDVEFIEMTDVDQFVDSYLRDINFEAILKKEYKKHIGVKAKNMIRYFQRKGFNYLFTKDLERKINESLLKRGFFLTTHCRQTLTDHYDPSNDNSINFERAIAYQKKYRNPALDLGAEEEKDILKNLREDPNNLGSEEKCEVLEKSVEIVSKKERRIMALNSEINKAGIRIDEELLFKMWDIFKNKIYSENNQTASEIFLKSKLEAFIEKNEQGFIQNAFVYYGAKTGRFSSEGVQIHNLPKIYEGSFEDLENIDNLDFSIDENKKKLTKMLRHLIIPYENDNLLIGDFSNIEPRILAVLSEEKNLLKEFEKDEDIYENFSYVLFNNEKSFKEDSTILRKISKMVFLGCMYGMGDHTLYQNLKKIGYNITINECYNFVEKFRGYFKNIYNFQKLLFSKLVKGDPFTLNNIEYRTDLFYEGGGLKNLIKLPTGRTVVLNNSEFLRINYPAKSMQFLVQAIARDVLCEKLLRLKERNFKIMMHVHDEIVCSEKAERFDEFKEIMEESIPVLPELKIKAKCGIFDRYT